MGVGFGGPIDWRTGRIECSHQIAGWAEFPLGDWLREDEGPKSTRMVVEEQEPTGEHGRDFSGY